MLLVTCCMTDAVMECTRPGDMGSWPSKPVERAPGKPAAPAPGPGPGEEACACCSCSRRSSISERNWRISTTLGSSFTVALLTIFLADEAKRSVEKVSSACGEEGGGVSVLYTSGAVGVPLSHLGQGGAHRKQ